MGMSQPECCTLPLDSVAAVRLGLSGGRQHQPDFAGEVAVLGLSFVHCSAHTSGRGFARWLSPAPMGDATLSPSACQDFPASSLRHVY